MTAPVETNIQALIRIVFGEPCQELIDVLLGQLLTAWDLINATGETLNQIGRLVGQPRMALVDDDYRRYIAARIVANKSTGRIEDLVLITKLVLDEETATIFVQNQGAAAVLITILDVAVTEELANIIIEFLRLPGAAGGVRVLLQTSAEDPATWMRWDVDNWDTKVMMTSRDRAR